MGIVDKINKFVDPFVMQLIIIPLISIGFGVYISIKKDNVLIAPIVTFLISLIFSKFILLLPMSSLLKFEWEIRFSLLSLIISFIAIKFKKGR